MKKDFDENGVCRDGGSVRVKMTAMDHSINDAIETLRDARMHRPGFRIKTDSRTYWDARSEKEAAYAAYDADVTSAYKNSPGGGGFDDPATGFGDQGPRGSVAGQTCGIDGRAGHLPNIGGKLVYMPDDYCSRDIDPEDFPRKKLKRNARGQEEGTEEFERDGGMRCPTCNGTGTVSWHHTHYRPDEDDDHEDDEGLINRIDNGSTQRGSVPDVTSYLRSQQHVSDMAPEYARYDQFIASQWKRNDDR